MDLPSLGPYKKRLRANIPLPVWLKLARLVSSLLYGTSAMLVLNLPAFENKKYTADDHFQGNGLYGEILTKKQPVRTLKFTLPYNNIAVYLLVSVQEFGHQPPDWLKEIASSSGIESKVTVSSSTHSLNPIVPGDTQGLIQLICNNGTVVNMPRALRGHVTNASLNSES